VTKDQGDGGGILVTPVGQEGRQQKATLPAMPRNLVPIDASQVPKGVKASVLSVLGKQPAAQVRPVIAVKEPRGSVPVRARPGKRQKMEEETVQEQKAVVRMVDAAVQVRRRFNPISFQLFMPSFLFYLVIC
jgi:hypothetical protein